MAENDAGPSRRKANKGPRPKHVPVRTCAMCREQSTKRTLTRVVRQPDGGVVLDPGGRMNGRGAYVCDKPECRLRAANTDALAKALHAELSQELRDQLRQMSLEVDSNVSAGTDNTSEVA